jgi:hypothetical protein
MGVWVVNATPWLLYPREKNLIPTVQEELSNTQKQVKSEM